MGVAASHSVCSIIAFSLLLPKNNVRKIKTSSRQPAASHRLGYWGDVCSGLATAFFLTCCLPMGWAKSWFNQVSPCSGAAVCIISILLKFLHKLSYGGEHVTRQYFHPRGDKQYDSLSHVYGTTPQNL